MGTDRSEIMGGITAILHDVLDEPDLVLHDHTTAADVAGWDSLRHIDIIVAIERKFKIRFTTKEATTLKNVGELVDLTQRKIDGAR